MNLFGDKTPKAVVLFKEMHKFGLAFSVAAGQKVRLMQPVKFAADGTITPLLPADPAHLSIGVSLHDRPAELTYADEQTIALRGYALSRSQAGTGGVVAGPVKWAAFDEATGVNVYVQSTDGATTIGHAVSPASAGGEVNVILL